MVSLWPQQADMCCLHCNKGIFRGGGVFSGFKSDPPPKKSKEREKGDVLRYICYRVNTCQAFSDFGQNEY